MKIFGVDPNIPSSMEIFRRFYYELFIKEFNDPNMYRDYIEIRRTLNKYRSNIDIYNIYIMTTDNEDEIVGGIIYDYYREIKSLALQFLVINRNYRGQNLGAELIEKATARYKIPNSSNGYKGDIDFIFIEVDKKNDYWKRVNGYKRCNLDYIQPAVHKSKKPVTNLDLLYCNPSGKRIHRGRIYLFLLYYAKFALDIGNPEADESIINMRKQLFGERMPDVHLPK